jgi:2-methylisocitrate lyase-like PEP mutase family enzyme
MESKARRLRELISAPDILVMPGIFDGYSGRLVARADFQAAFITGGGLSESKLGLADMGIMGREENLDACRNLARCCPLPLIGDADTGYGNAVNVYYAVKDFENAGLAGLMIEDQVWPKRCGHYAGKQVISSQEGLEKIRAAAAARTDPDFVIKARTDAFATHGIDEVIKRLNLYGDGGADLLFADALLSVADIQTVVKHVSKPLCVNMGFGLRTRSTTPLLSARQLQDLGVSVVIYPRLLTAAALQGMDNAINALQASLHAETQPESPHLLFSFDRLNDVMGLAELQALEQRFAAEQPPHG